VGHQRQRQTFVLELGHDAGKAHALDTDEAFNRNHADIKEQLGSIRAPPAHLCQLATYRKTGGALLYEQLAHSAESFIAWANCHGVVIGAHATGDGRLAARDAVEVTFAHRAGPEVGYIGTTTRLGNGQRDNLVARQYFGHDTVTNRRLGPFEDRWQTNIQRAEAGDQAGRTATNQLLTGRHLGKQVAFMTAAVLLGKADPENPGVPGFF